MLFHPTSTPIKTNASLDSQFTSLATHYDELMEVVPYPTWVEYVQLLLNIANVHPRRILDCACGTGNVTFELAKCGYEVLGIDLSAGMIEAAQRKSRGSALPVNFVQGDLTDFELQQTFDAATCLYDSFNYILVPTQLQSAFGRVAAHVKQGGILVFDMNTPWAFEANLFSQRNRNPRNNLHYDWTARYDQSTRICEVTMHFERRRDGQVIEQFAEIHRERAYLQSEVTALLTASNWRVLKIYDAYTLNQPHDRSERWFFVAQRV